MNKKLIDLDSNLSSNDPKKLLENNHQSNEKDCASMVKKQNQLIKTTNENKIVNENKLDQLLIKMEKGNENQSQPIMSNLTGQQSQLAFNQIHQQMHQQQFDLQHNLLNHPNQMHPLFNSELSIEQLNQLYYYYYPYYYLYKLNESSNKSKTLV